MVSTIAFRESFIEMLPHVELKHWTLRVPGSNGEDFEVLYMMTFVVNCTLVNYGLKYHAPLIRFTQ